MNCAGNCSLNLTTMHSFEPIDLSSTGILNLYSSNLNGSITDEDVKGLVGAEINWDSSSIGSGGYTDRWIIEVEGQTLQAPLPNVMVMLEGLGYWNETKQLWSNDDGSISVPSRIVQWMDSSGGTYTEDAKISSVTFSEVSNSWGTFSGPGGSLGTEDLNITLNLPLISVAAITVSETKAKTSTPLDVELTIQNDGAAATIRLSCTDSTGQDVSTSPSFIPVTAAAETSTVVQFTWTQFSKGEESITCTTMLPSALKDHSTLVLADGPAASSDSIDWAAPIDPDEGGVVTLMIIAIVIAILCLLFYSRKMTAATEEDVVVEDEEFEEESDEPNETESKEQTESEEELEEESETEEEDAED